MQRDTGPSPALKTLLFWSGRGVEGGVGEHRHINKQMTVVLSERNSSHVQRDCNCGGIWFSFTVEVTFPPGPETKKYQVKGW